MTPTYNSNDMIPDAQMYTLEIAIKAITELRDTLTAVTKAGQRLHDAMDDVNSASQVDSIANCKWCKGTGYDSDGLIHKSNCPLVVWRQTI